MVEIPRRYDLAGKVFTRLTVKEYAGIVGKGHRAWLCVCSCGVEKVVVGHSLKRGDTTSCGCLQKEITTANRTVHGDHRSPEYKAWSHMWSRTTNPKCPNYELYKDRAPSPEFKSYEFFIAHLGRRPGPEYS